MTYEMVAESIALSIWEISTGNGRDLDESLWDDHMQNCQAATSNSYFFGISEQEWMDKALSIVS